MKKLLLLSAALLATAPMWADAVTDGDTYETTNDIQCINSWIIDRNHNSAVFAETEVFQYTNCRTSAVQNGVAYVSSWAANDPEVTSTDDDGNVTNLNAASIYMYSVEDGSYLGVLKLTLDGERLTGTGVANQVGFDSFGHLYISNITFAGDDVQPVYIVDQETGALTLVASLDKGSDTPRIDYLDVIGDLTGTEADCTIMAAGSSDTRVFGWCLDKGTTSWYGYFTNSVSMVFTEYYPSSAANWGTAPYVKIVEGEGESQYWGELYYVDGFSSAPTLYNSTGAIVESFADAEDLVQVSLGANGVVEFSVDSRDFIAYPIQQYTGDDGGCNVYICELGEGMTFKGMTLYWMVPKTGFGTTSDGGTRIHGLSREYVTNSDGSEYVNLFSFKCYNGMALYKIGKTIDDSGIEGTLIDGNRTVVAEKFYNLAGAQVAEPTDGKAIYIVTKTYSDGTTATVKEVR